MLQRTCVALLIFAAASEPVAPDAADADVGAAGVPKFPQGDCKDDHAQSETCCDVTVENNPECFNHITWAKDVGFASHKKWYDVYGVKKESSFDDFQCALFWISREERENLAKAGNVETAEHGCPRPCKSTLDTNPHCELPPTTVDPNFNPILQNDGAVTVSCPAPNVPVCAEPTCLTTIPVPAQCPNKTAPDCLAKKCTESQCGVCPPEKAPPPSLPTWAIVVIAFLVLGLFTALAVYLIMGSGKKGAKKKKRSVVPKKAPEPAPTPAAPSITMAPVPVTTSMMMQPMLQHPAAYTIALPVGMQHMQAQQTTTVPMVQYAQPQMMQQAYAQPQMVQQMQHFG